MSDANVEHIVHKAIADVLSIEPSEVVPDARWFTDLNGESIELLELSFQMEKQFNCRMDFTKALGGTDLPRGPRGELTLEALRELKERYPFLRVEQLKPSPTPEDLKDLLTVDAIVHFVEEAIRAAIPRVAPA